MDLGNVNSWSVILVGIISMGLILKASVMANNIGMSVNSSGASNLIAGAVGSPIAPRGGGNMVREIIKTRKT